MLFCVPFCSILFCVTLCCIALRSVVLCCCSSKVKTKFIPDWTPTYSNFKPRVTRTKLTTHSHPHFGSSKTFRHLFWAGKKKKAQMKIWSGINLFCKLGVALRQLQKKFSHVRSTDRLSVLDFSLLLLCQQWGLCVIKTEHLLLYHDQYNNYC